MDKEGVVAEDVREQKRFIEARAGDHLMIEFQCDVCHFRNIQRRDPDPKEAKDYLLMVCIRRCLIDSVWSKEPTTVEHNRRDVLKIISKGEELGLAPSRLFPPRRSRPLVDECNMSLAAVMMYRSLDPGKNDTFVQFNTVRSMRAAVSNYWKALAPKDEMTVLMRGQTKLTSSSSPTNSSWFESFMLGYHKRVGDISRPDRAISIELMVAIMNRFEDRWSETNGSQSSQKEVLFPALFAICAYVASLRGEEVPLMNLGETRAKTCLGINDPDQPHVVIALTGRFKNEIGVFDHYIPVVRSTNSGLKVQLWIERMLQWYGPHRRGYVFWDESGERVTCGHYATDILGIIKEIQTSDLPMERNLVDPDCDVLEEYGMTRSFRRGLDSRAHAAGVSESTIDLMNRWRKTERAQGRLAHLKMNAHYSDVRLLIKKFLPYSQAL